MEMLTTNDGIARTKEREQKNGEFFTPDSLVEKMMAKVSESDWKDPTKTFLDPTCGNGQILVNMAKKRLASGVSKADVAKTLYGVELMQDNRDMAVKRVLELVGEENREIVEHNIVCSDFFEWDFEQWKPLADIPLNFIQMTSAKKRFLIR